MPDRSFSPAPYLSAAVPRRLASRLLAALGLLAALLLVVAVLVGLLAYGTEPRRSGRLTLDGLTRLTAVGWTEAGDVIAEAATETDLMAALGYAHTADHAWAMALWRQVALGRMAAWFGPSWRELDRHARYLGFAALAQQTYRALPSAERALLDAYALGVNRALGEAAVAQRDEFVFLDVEAEAWEPWHALAVERLIAWMGTPRLAPPPFADGTLAAFARTDSLYRATLRLDGAAQSRAWAAALGDGGTTVVQQLAYGASALPLIQPVTLRLNGRSALAATVPGTLMLPAGQDDARSWTVFLTSDVRSGPADGPLPPPVHDRLVDREGNETLLVIYRDSTSLFLRAAEAARPARPPVDTLRVDSLAADSFATDSVTVPPTTAPPPRAWQIQWRGFAEGTDLGAWRALLSGEAPPPFRLIRGDGLVATREGASTVLGAPPLRREVPGGVFVAADSLARFAADHLAVRLTAPDSARAAALTPEALTADAYSAWAAARLPGLLRALGHRDSLRRDLKDPYAYLLSWDHAYSEDAIGASIYETWLDAHRSVTGALPAPSDSTNRLLLHQTLRIAVAILRDRYGDRPSGWRWANVQPGARYYPISDSAGATGGLPHSRYGPLARSPGGHPTALQVGPSLVFGEPPAPAVWTAWTTTTDWDALTVRHSVIRPGDFLARTATEPDVPRLIRRNAPLTAPLALRPDEP